MEEKDRLGDKLRDKGKAAEDLYIAQQERQQAAKQKATGQGGPACPRDGTPLKLREEQGVPIDLCPTCGGMWLDKGELEAIVEKEDEAGVTRWVRSLLGS